MENQLQNLNNIGRKSIENILSAGIQDFSNK